jgi:hypothetical protein
VYLALLLFFYFNYFWLIPVFYFRRKYGGFFLITFLCFIVLVLVPNLMTEFREGPPGAGYQWPANSPMPRPIPMPDNPPPEGLEPPPPYPHDDGPGRPPNQLTSRSLLLDVSHQVFLFLAVFFFSLILRISYRWRQTEREKLNAELAYLKAQINPHFLFNILNTIYSLAIEKSDQTATAVVELSQMMRYVISEAGHHLVPLSKEIDYISNYIALQRLRFGDTIPLSYTVTGTPSGQLIAPLILISFVENAFKHGVNSSEDADIRINIVITDKQLHFTAFNNKVTIQEIPESGGLGIENTRQRLQLLYPANHTLEIKDELHHFSVSLILTLT